MYADLKLEILKRLSQARYQLTEIFFRSGKTSLHAGTKCGEVESKHLKPAGKRVK
jgi:hypothetical protein